MRYVFLEKIDISKLEEESLNINYSRYANVLDLEIYKVLVEQTRELNYTYNSQNLVNKLQISVEKVHTSLAKLVELELLDIYRNDVYIFKLKKVKINSSFYDLNFVTEKSFVDYSNFQKYKVETKTNLNFDLNLFNTFLPKSNIFLSKDDITKIENFKKVNPINDAKLLELVKRAYDRQKGELDTGKLNFLFNDDFPVVGKISPSISSWIEQKSNKLYANSDKDVFVKILNKHTNLNTDQIKAIITYVYKTQKNVYFNFVDKLAITLQQEKIQSYEECLKYLLEFKSKKTNFSPKKNQFKNEQKTSSLDFDNLSRGVEKGVAISVKELLKQQNDK